MPYNQTSDSKPVVTIENMQEFYSSILEYYDELFPLDERTIPFFERLQNELLGQAGQKPAPMIRFLGIGCATGNLENKILAQGMDITGIDQNPNMIETAKRRMKRGFSNIRFFEMSTIDIVRFLKKGSFNIISCLGNVLPYISDETLMRKFFHDIRQLLAPNGVCVLETMNYDGIHADATVNLPERSSVRVNLKRRYLPSEEGRVLLDATLEQGNGKQMVLQHSVRLLPITVSKVETYAREAGFATTVVYGDFSGAAWSKASPTSLFVLR